MNDDQQRHEMVERQLIRRGVSSPQVLAAFRKIPRHAFVPSNLHDLAYTDQPLQIGEGQTISQPYIVALMTELAQVSPTDTVLEIGTGSGYQTAILAELAERVVTIERFASLILDSQTVLQHLGYTNITFETGDGTMGFADQAPYQAIVVTAGAPAVPVQLQSQLDEGGRMIIPVGDCRRQSLLRITRQGDHFAREDHGGCVFVPLIGAEGW